MTTPLPFLATALVLAMAPPVSRSQVVVDTAGLRQAGVEQLEGTIETTGTMVDLNLREELKKRGVEVVDDPAAPRIEVALFWKDYRASHFSITIEIVRPDGSRIPLPRFECKHCGNNDLLDRIHAELPVVLEQLEADPEPPPPAIVTPAPPPAETLLPRKDLAPPPLGARGKAGISCLVLGGAAVVLGGVFMGLGRQPIDDNPAAGERRTGIDYRPPGIALLSVGGTAVISGAILLALDRGYAHGKASRRDSSRRSVSFNVLPPLPGPSLLGASYSARF